MLSMIGSSASPFSRQRVLDPRRHLGVGVALDDPLLLQRPQPQRQRAGTDPGKRALELAEARMHPSARSRTSSNVHFPQTTRRSDIPDTSHQAPYAFTLPSEVAAPRAGARRRGEEGRVSPGGPSADRDGRRAASSRWASAAATSSIVVPRRPVRLHQQLEVVGARGDLRTRPRSVTRPALTWPYSAWSKVCMP